MLRPHAGQAGAVGSWAPLRAFGGEMQSEGQSRVHGPLKNRTAGAWSFTKSEVGTLVCVTSEHCGGLGLPETPTAVGSAAVRQGRASIAEKC